MMTRIAPELANAAILIVPSAQPLFGRAADKPLVTFPPRA